MTFGLCEGEQHGDEGRRHPLLLGFLVRSFVDRVPYGTRRAQLYGQIVRQIRDREPRPGRSEATISVAVADRTLEKIGWLLQRETIVSGQEIAAELGEELSPSWAFRTWLSSKRPKSA